MILKFIFSVYYCNNRDHYNTATVCVSDNGSDSTVVIAIAVGVCVGLLIIAAVIIVIAVLIYRYKVKNGYMMNFAKLSYYVSGYSIIS